MITNVIVHITDRCIKFRPIVHYHSHERASMALLSEAYAVAECRHFVFFASRLIGHLLINTTQLSSVTCVFSECWCLRKGLAVLNTPVILQLFLFLFIYFPFFFAEIHYIVCFWFNSSTTITRCIINPLKESLMLNVQVKWSIYWNKKVMLLNWLLACQLQHCVL